MTARKTPMTGKTAKRAFADRKIDGGAFVVSAVSSKLTVKKRLHKKPKVTYSAEEPTFVSLTTDEVSRINEICDSEVTITEHVRAAIATRWKGMDF